MSFVKIAEEEGDEPMELPIEEDGSLLLTTLMGQFPGACGLKYRNPESLAWRGIRLSDTKLFGPVELSGGWGTQIYITVMPKADKRKSDELLATENSVAKNKRMERSKCSEDLIVLGLPWKTTEPELRKYFEGFGEVLMAQVKKDIKSGQSKGFGFIRFATYEAQMRVLAQRHMIDGRWCDVKIPNSKEGNQPLVPCKVFVGRCTEEITAEDLKDYFCKYGEVTDVFIPKPFRAFAFVTFLDPEVAQGLCGEDHIVKGVSVHISNAAPKQDHRRQPRGAQHGGPPGRGMSMGGTGAMPPGDRGGHGSGFSQPGPYVQGTIGMGGTGWTPPGGGAGGRGSLEMPNIAGLGLSGNHQAGQQSGNNPMGMGLNLGMPMNPALVAAALNQAGWGLIGNLQGSNAAGSGTDHGFPTPTSFSTPGNVTTTQVGQGHNAAQGNQAASGALTGWGAANAPTGPVTSGGGHGGGSADQQGIPAQTPPTVTPQHHPGAGSWPSQTRDKHGGSWRYGEM